MKLPPWRFRLRFFFFRRRRRRAPAVADSLYITSFCVCCAIFSTFFFFLGSYQLSYAAKTQSNLSTFFILFLGVLWSGKAICCHKLTRKWTSPMPSARRKNHSISDARGERDNQVVLVALYCPCKLNCGLKKYGYFVVYCCFFSFSSSFLGCLIKGRRPGSPEAAANYVYERRAVRPSRRIRLVKRSKNG